MRVYPVEKVTKVYLLLRYKRQQEYKQYKRKEKSCISFEEIYRRAIEAYH